MKNILIYILGLGLLVSCQTDLDIPFPEHKPQLTLNSYLIEDGFLFLYVTRSFSSIEPVERTNDTSLVVKDAEVSIWKDGVKLGDLTFLPSSLDTFPATAPSTDTFFIFVDRSVYLLEDSSIKPKVGETYEYRASHPIYGNASATATVMPKPRIEGTEWVEDSLVNIDFDGYRVAWDVLKITIEDPAEIINYYNFKGTVKVRQEFDFGSGPSVDTVDITALVATEIERDGSGYVFGSNYPISDEDFNGQRKQLTLYVQMPDCCGYPGDQQNEFFKQEILSLDVQAFMMDANYGIFQEKKVLQRNNRTDGIEGAILPREPVSVVGNVEGGYGLVGSFNYEEVRLDF